MINNLLCLIFYILLIVKMGKNTKGGKGAKRGKNNNQNSNSSKEIPLPDDTDEYIGLVLKNNGDSRFDVKIVSDCNFKNEIKNMSMKKSGPCRRRFGADTYVLIYHNAPPEGTNKFYIMYPYQDHEKKYLFDNNIIPRIKDDNGNDEIAFSDNINENDILNI